MERLRQMRQNKELSQAEMALFFGVARPTYTKWETGEREPDFKTISRLADYFKVSTDYLLERTDDPTPPDKKKEAPAIDQAEALRIYAEGKKGAALTQEQLNRLDEFADVFIKGLDK